MVPVLTAAEMRDADRRTIEELGLPGAVLMENAGAAVARAIRDRFPDAKRPAVLCGKGNNGGDGFVAARHLLDLRPTVFLLGSRAEARGDARLHLGVYERSGGTVREVPDDGAWATAWPSVREADLVVDALLGTGLNQEPSGLIGRAIRDLAGRAGPGRAPLVAVDIPSGLSSDNGETSWPTLTAQLTVTFAAPKYGHVLPPACERVGELVVADIGIPRALLEGARLWRLEAGDAARVFPPREPGAHKGSFGHVLVVAGSVGKTGAAILAATAALRTGAGLVTVATPAPALPMIAAGRAEIMTEPLPVDAGGALEAGAVTRALALAKDRDAVVLGPGLGTEAGPRAFVRDFVRRCPSPLLVDADGLNALAPSAKERGATDALRRSAPTVVTPHPGEMARLVGSSSGEVQRRRLETARAFAMETGAVVVLKGQRTLVADPDGRAAVNPTGNPGMATGGTGDVLSGIAGALLARGCDAWTASTAAVYLHGLAGDQAAARLGQESLLAGDVVSHLSRAFRILERARA
ncbi:MAG: bifunctional ADP-dependent NAD(P)H-hydrate dehydratase/NAD(P)H-hydrate epimerase [Acidobacteria bacterium]|nr:MAG: bifunctional ADP-dependent NAD(P)H-hydrate dehydratase/NAD(P)H-hydrate epimerase [Acidobacteriota bacterium]